LFLRKISVEGDAVSEGAVSHTGIQFAARKVRVPFHNPNSSWLSWTSSLVGLGGLSAHYAESVRLSVAAEWGKLPEAEFFAARREPPRPPLEGRGEGDPDLPELLHNLDARRFTGPTGVWINVKGLGQFQIYHVPDNGNCLFSAIGRFLRTRQEEVRLQMGCVDGRIWGGDNEIKIAAKVFGTRIFVVHRDAGTARIEGYKARTGAPIDMTQGVVRSINPDQDIVLYAILDPAGAEGQRHFEALVPA
jgi:hypothetical protein